MFDLYWPHYIGVRRSASASVDQHRCPSISRMFDTFNCLMDVLFVAQDAINILNPDHMITN
jgi:hypothetical protein